MKKIFAIVLTLLIPLLLFLIVLQSSRYVSVERELADYNKEQARIVEENKNKISGISILSKPERIEKIAVEELKMRKALSGEILRVSISKENKDG
ncbi:cell division protein FtsL [Treponema putidum]|uniref:Cell division protein FtsL n=1 Tax=Treponema putidum TaxID=221027 RepID=A0AAE9SI71_9SPIR|nr:cell division protein FtsL [Treponema putidum]AIN94923.1 cell division protein FtsL [Treponema putidum]TWI77079.1 cell division protein FtsL [Treponema putidum]UTY28943.1 cell division protein FtsL [Treponema putidum]UTY31358.1 cell division protein FtsL [Treponema putidum]UTY33795.1 cell division protein FtsL [Treponema putidum]